MPDARTSISPKPVIAILLLGVLAFALLAWWAGRTTVRRQQRAIADCRDRYAAARSAADSTNVDMAYLSSFSEQTGGKRAARTCGDLRLAGKLK